jgi:hypothetical protein
MTKFEYGNSYPIETLPDDLHEEGMPHRDKWSLKSAMFWNDCQGWWHESISSYWLHNRYSTPIARFWSPEPPAPMTRLEILAERNMAVCEHCDYAITIGEPHNCNGPSENLIEQRRLQGDCGWRADRMNRRSFLFRSCNGSFSWNHSSSCGTDCRYGHRWWRA